jgi:hypothetical protein
MAEPVPIAIRSVFCSVPAFVPIDIAPVDIEMLPAPVPIAIGSVYTAPVAVTFQSE